MKKAELFFGFILLPIDYLMLLLAGLTAYSLRFADPITSLQPVVYDIPFGRFMATVLIAAAGWLLIFAWAGLYRIRGTRRIIEEVRKVFLACSTAVLIIIVWFFLDRDLFSSRFIILAAYVFSLLYVTAARLIVLLVERGLFAQGIGVHNIVIIGKTHLAELITSEINQKPALGFHIQAQFDSFTAASRKEMEKMRQNGLLDEIIFADPEANKKQNEQLIDFCNEHHITFKYAAAFFDTQSTNISIQPIAGVPVIEIKRTKLDGWGRIVKRLFDVIGSLLLIVLTSPIMLITTIAILIEGGRPILFSKKDDGEPVQRVGQYGSLFNYFKFRSMKPNTDSLRYGKDLQKKNMRKGSPLVKIEDDPRITSVGKFIRRFSIDELPEFFLVLKGDMSLVGPRPHLPEEVEKYEKHQKQVLHMKPGITGIAQISGRSDLDFNDEIRLDVFYMENWALWLDIVILLKTPFAVFKNRTAL